MLAYRYVSSCVRPNLKPNKVNRARYAPNKRLAPNRVAKRHIQLPAFLVSNPLVRYTLRKLGAGSRPLKVPSIEEFEKMDDETKFNWALVGTRVVSPWDKSETLARTLLRELIAKNHLQAKYTYATSIFAGVIRGDREEAVKLWEDCSRADHSWAKFNLASLLAEGKVDTERAVRLYEEAWNCKPVLSEAHAHTAALNLSTLLYSLGRTNEAASWLIKAADEAHDSLAQYQLAHAYSHGTKGLPLDLEKAKAYNTRAADGGMSLAQHNLGCLFHEASPTPDYEAAAYYFAKAHFQGYYWSTLNLATMYARGRGVPQNFATAHLLLRDVATFGSEDQKKAAKLVQENVNKLENGEEVPEDAPAAKPAGR